MTSLAPSDFSVIFLDKSLLILNIFSLISLDFNSFSSPFCLLSTLLNKFFIKFISLSLISSLLIITSNNFASASFNLTSFPVCFNILSLKTSLLILSSDLFSLTMDLFSFFSTLMISLTSSSIKKSLFAPSLIILSFELSFINVA